jgi:hypothetical protein
VFGTAPDFVDPVVAPDATPAVVRRTRGPNRAKGDQVVEMYNSLAAVAGAAPVVEARAAVVGAVVDEVTAAGITFDEGFASSLVPGAAESLTLAEAAAPVATPTRAEMQSFVRDICCKRGTEWMLEHVLRPNKVQRLSDLSDATINTFYTEFQS